MTRRPLLAALLIAYLAGCSTERTESVKSTLKSKGVEVEHGQVKRVFRF